MTIRGEISIPEDLLAAISQDIELQHREDEVRKRLPELVQKFRAIMGFTLEDDAKLLEDDMFLAKNTIRDILKKRNNTVTDTLSRIYTIQYGDRRIFGGLHAERKRSFDEFGDNKLLYLYRMHLGSTDFNFIFDEKVGFIESTKLVTRDNTHLPYPQVRYTLNDISNERRKFPLWSRPMNMVDFNAAQQVLDHVEKTGKIFAESSYH